jgi:hypothetical protein
MRDRLPRIIGGILLFFSFILLIFSPDKAHFSILHFYLFLVCFALGMLSIVGLIGSHPIATRMRREAALTGTGRTTPPINVREQVFPYAVPGFKRSAAAILCAVIGLALIGLGLFMASAFPSKGADRIVAGIPAFAAGALCLWIAIRYPSRYIRITSREITVAGYFRMVTIRWQDVVALVAREHYIFSAGVFAPLGVTHFIYSMKSRTWYSSRIPESARLTAIISQTSGLPWQ